MNTVLMLQTVVGPEGYHPNEDPEGDGSMMTKTFTITLSIAGSYMMLVVGLMIWCRHRRKRRKQAYLNANGAEGTDTLCKWRVHVSYSMSLSYITQILYSTSESSLFYLNKSVLICSIV
jgi:hypothetical protein